MKKQFVIWAVSAVVLSVMAQDPGDTNAVPRSWSSNHTESTTNRPGFKRDKRRPGGRHEKMNEAQKQQRRLQFMEKELKRIGVTEEEQAQIMELQKAYKTKMETNSHRIATARKNLSKLMDEGASMEALEGAIREISDAQADQLRILVHNRIEMERILGKNKHDQFMKNARSQYHKHGRRGGDPLPPRPGDPPLPAQPKVPSRPAAETP